jgi:Ser/Thr protein kinase RdoA (MazF antagonist)
MHLTVANLAHFLINRGLLSADAIVAGDVVILDASRRNRNFKVIHNSGPGLFVKQPREMQLEALLRLHREAACYESARDDPMLRRLMPRLITYDAARHVLILELLADAESLRDRHVRENTFPVEIGRTLGESLGLYHAHTASILEDEAMRSLFPRLTPAVLKLQAGGFAAVSQFHQIGRVLSAVIHQHPEFQSLLDALGAEWRRDTLVHGDLRLENVLVLPETRDGLDFRIVDWELADLGDAAWDVGAVLQSFLRLWILSMPIASGLMPELYVEMAAQPIELMRPMLRAFWNAYADARGFAESERQPALERSMRFGAAWLVSAAAEESVHATELDPAAIAMLQMSFNILENPAQAVIDLLEV